MSVGEYDIEVKAPGGHFRVIGRRGDSEWVIGDRTSRKLADDLAEEEKCVGCAIEVYDDQGDMVGRV